MHTSSPFLFIRYPLYFFCSQFIANIIISGNWTLEKLQSLGGYYLDHLKDKREALGDSEHVSDFAQIKELKTTGVQPYVAVLALLWFSGL